MAMTRPGARRTPTVVLLLLPARLGAPAVADEGAAHLGDLTIEQLMNVEITSVSKKEEPLLQPCRPPAESTSVSAFASGDLAGARRGQPAAPSARALVPRPARQRGGRLGWRPIPAVGVSLALQDLLDEHHVEFGRPNRVNPTAMERSLYGKITL